MPPVNGAPAIAEGRVALRTEDPLLPAPRFVPDAQAIRALEQALHYVRRWPLAAKQWPDIVHTIQCYHDTEQPTEGPGRLGSASHSVDARFGVIGLTVNCPLATAQAIVHEMAHHKLRAFGVANENAIRIISNPQDELYPSPIVVDRPRPMTAVLHAQYSFIHVTQLDVHMLEQEDDPQVRSDIRALLARNASRMEQGSRRCGSTPAPMRPAGRFSARSSPGAATSWRAAGRCLPSERGAPVDCPLCPRTGFQPLNARYAV